MMHLVRGDADSQLSTLPFGWIGQTAVALGARGIDIEDQLLELGIGAGKGRIDDATPLNAGEYMLMCVRVINAVDDEMHGTTRGQMRRGTAALGHKLFGTGATLGQALDFLVRFYGIAGSFCDIRLCREEGLVRLLINADGGRCDLTATIEEMMATHLHMLASHYLGFLLPLTQFVTTSAHHPSLGARHPYLGAPATLGRTTQIAFSASYLDLKSKESIHAKDLVDAVMHWLTCLGAFEDLELRSKAGDGMSHEVFASLASQDLSFEECCAEIGIGVRDLRAALFAEGVTYRRLRQLALLERARPYLEAQATTDDMAFDLGYSDARSLRRALKSATGLRLSEIRQPRVRSAAIPGSDLLRNLRVEMVRMS